MTHLSTIEIVAGSLAVVLSVLSTIYSYTRLIRRARIEIKIRNRLDALASRDKRFNALVKEANSAFTNDNEEYSMDHVRKFRRTISKEVGNSIVEYEQDVFEEIINKSDDQMLRYSERVAHSIAGRRGYFGMLFNDLVGLILRAFGLRSGKYGRRT